MLCTPLHFRDDVIRLSRGPAVTNLTYRVPPQDHRAYPLPAGGIASGLIAAPMVPIHPMVLPPMLQAMTVLPKT